MSIESSQDQTNTRLIDPGGARLGTTPQPDIKSQPDIKKLQQTKLNSETLDPVAHKPKTLEQSELNTKTLEQSEFNTKTLEQSEFNTQTTTKQELDPKRVDQLTRIYLNELCSPDERTDR